MPRLLPAPAAHAVHRAAAPLQRRLNLALRARVAGPDADQRAADIWLAPGPRWFGPDDPIVRVHAHAGMYVGGIRALLLQSLHPLAMAGVGEHSGYRADTWGRLARTSFYIAMTTFGPIPSAEAAIARVRRIHTTVTGTAADGRPYAADDPHLLRWVHVAEIDSFLAAHQRWSRTPLTPAEADTYVSQTGDVVVRLGLPDPPRTVAELTEQLTAYDPELEATPGALDVAQLLLREPPLPRSQRPGFAMLAAGAVTLLPDRARELLHLPRGAAYDRLVGGPLGAAATAAVGWALADPEAHHRQAGSSLLTDRR